MAGRSCFRIPHRGCNNASADTARLQILHQSLPKSHARATYAKSVSLFNVVSGPNSPEDPCILVNSFACWSQTTQFSYRAWLESSSCLHVSDHTISPPTIWNKKHKIPNRQKADMHSTCIMTLQSSRSRSSGNYLSRSSFQIQFCYHHYYGTRFWVRFPPKHEVAWQCPVWTGNTAHLNIGRQ